MVIVDNKIDDAKKEHLHCKPFRWPCRCVEAMHVALPDSANPGPH
jgi:hypothetical protein